VVSPAVCSSYASLSAIENCSSESDAPCDSSDSENPCGECCSMGCCECDFFLLSTRKSSTPLLSLEEKINLLNEDARSSYLSECWRPPQAA